MLYLPVCVLKISLHTEIIVYVLSRNNLTFSFLIYCNKVCTNHSPGFGKVGVRLI